jgi:hypothetical protein
MRKILLAGALLALAACNGNKTDANAVDANAVAVDNLAVDENVAVDQNMTLPDANGSVDANTVNALVTDATTHDADTNLANGM